MILSEMFYTLQGEGSFIGIPSVFIRTASCNLRCGWCDTAYTSWWIEGKKRPVDDIMDLMYSSFDQVEHVVVSGGEPMIQKDINELISKLMDKGHTVTIETNGTVFKEDVKPSLFSISPKLKNSIPSEDNHPVCFEEWESEKALHEKNNNLDALADFIKSGIPYQMKFVVQDEFDMKEIYDLINKYDIPKKNVFLMPEGYTQEKQRMRSAEIAEICKSDGFTFCPRLHVELWGTKRGV